MEEQKKLYPLRFIPRVREKDWGTETLLVADLGEHDSEVLSGWLAGNTLSELMQTYLERVVGEGSFDVYGTQFPVAVRQLDVRSGKRLSLRLNPDDETAAQRYDSFGRTALWYVADADASATVWMGLARDTSAEEFYRSSLDGSLEGLLKAWKPRPGDVFLIPPGTLYAAKGRLRLLEISESSDLWFRIYDWGAGKELHLEEAFDLIDFRRWDPRNFHRSEAGEGATELLSECPQFALTLFRLDHPARVQQPPEGDSFLVYHCLSGEALLQLPDSPDAQYPVRAGETLLVPDEVEDFYLIPGREGTRLVEVLLPPRPAADEPVAEEA